MTTTPGAELRRLRSLVADLDAVVWEADAVSGRFTFVSQRAWDMLGYPPNLWIERHTFWADHVHPEDRERAVKEFMAAVTEGRPHDLEYRFLHRDGSTVWLRDLGHTVTDIHGEPLVVRGLMVDVTSQKLAEERRAEVEQRYRNLVEELPAVVYTESFGQDEARTVYVSPRIRSLLGVDPEAWLGPNERWLAQVHPDDRERVRELNERSERTLEPFVAEYRLLREDGGIVWVHDQAALLRDEQGNPTAWQGVLMDITERQRAADLERELEEEREESAQLREVDRMKNTFLQAVSHDLRTPLAAILGLAVTLEREDLELNADDAQDMAKRIAANARKLDRMVNDLLDLDRLSRGIVEPTITKTDVGSLVTHLVSESDVAAGREVVVEAPQIWAEVDAAKVERIVENLLANATRHTPSGTPIRVSVSRNGTDLLLAVEDEGPGVPPEIRESIFEPFRQGPEAPEYSPGVGIGLALVARFAEIHGGRAWVEDRKGGGASFRVRLPLAHQPSS